MRLTKFLTVTLVTVMLPVSLTFGQTGLSNKQAAVAKQKVLSGKTDKPIPKKPVITRSKKKNAVPEVPLTNARIAFEYAKFDFGTVPNGAQMTHFFPVTNIGPDTLYITKIKAG